MRNPELVAVPGSLEIAAAGGARSDPGVTEVRTRDDRGNHPRGFVRFPGVAMRTAAVEPWRYELAVFCSDVVDAVISAGGWMYDRARTGWNVSVIADDRGGVRPLAILGACAMSRQDYFESMLHRSAPTALAIDSSALGDDRNPDACPRCTRRGRGTHQLGWRRGCGHRVSSRAGRSCAHRCSFCVQVSGVGRHRPNTPPSRSSGDFPQLRSVVSPRMR